MNKAAIDSLSQRVMEYMPQIKNYRDSFDSLNKLLGKTTLTGKISCLDVAENLFLYMDRVKENFGTLQSELMDVLVGENITKAFSEIRAISQVTIDVLIRNLFERTADVGFLATDDDLREFLKNREPTEGDKERILERLVEYVKKYSVYDEIILLDPRGEVVIHLDQTNALPKHSKDPLIAETLLGRREYIETFRHSDLQPAKPQALIYSAPIKNSNGGNEMLGVLCLCFKIEDEMERIYSHLLRGNNRVYIALLAPDTRIISSSRPDLLPSGAPLVEQSLIAKVRSEECLCCISETNGYQGYMGSGWKGAVLLPLRQFQHSTASRGVEAERSSDDLAESPLMDRRLHKIIQESEDLLEDLGDVVINGEIIASKQHAYELNPVLDNIRDISNKINDLSVQSIQDLLHTIFSSYQENFTFYASLAIDIMDRNLYERANDCRWWALTTAFRRALEMPEIPAPLLDELQKILAYINGLYTVYTNLFLFNRAGRILGVSNPQEHAIIGKTIPQEMLSKVMHGRNTQSYFVSPFEPTSFYGGRHTYVYYATILGLEPPHTTLGGIGIVFDGEPQFRAMLEDDLPRNDQGGVLMNSFALICDTHKQVISSTSEVYLVGSVLSWSDAMFRIKKEGVYSAVMEHEGERYLVGCKPSCGYREFKQEDGYVNDLVAIIAAKIT